MKQQVRAARFTVQRRVNTELIRLYWGIGATLLQRQGDDGWGSNVIGRLATDLRAEFPKMKGFSPRNLAHMRAFAAAWPDEQILQPAVAQLPWGHIGAVDRDPPAELAQPIGAGRGVPTL
ncbi:DUF1016 N-terminal domain-containing protein [Curtobacterium flaccumfaciens]|uniref:DUF1016 N-terminal domain-containing protein n=1 Tax=Curtobacterium flaccumfaciens TaxID=2035 RepID=UPI00387940A6